MPTPILMPALSPTMEKGNLAKWLVKEGDKVSSGDVLAEIETDKATMEVEAIDEGIIAKIVISAGTEDVAVNSTIAILVEEGEDVSSLETADTNSKTTPVVDQPKKNEQALNSAASFIPADAGTAGSKVPDRDRIFVSPLAKRVAKQKGIDLKSVKGSGPRGRIILKDVEGFLAAPAAQGESPASKETHSMQTVLTSFKNEPVSVPVDGMRKVIAERLTAAKQNVPHFYLSMDICLDNLLSVRAAANAASPKDGPNSYKLSVNDFIIKAHAMALQRVPDANAIWAENAILRFPRSDVAVAVAVEGGLFTPVIHAADLKSISQISREMKDLAERARKRRLMPEEYQGGTTAVSNLGMFGVKEFSAVINPPHGSILAVGAGEQRPVVVNGDVRLATVMSVTLSCDHRAVDGALGAQLLQQLKQLIENPALMLV